MQMPITKLERNNYNTNYKIKHAEKKPEKNKKELDLLLKSYHNFDN